MIFDLVFLAIIVASITVYGIIWTIRDRRREPMHRAARQEPVYVHRICKPPFDWERD